MGIFDFFKKDYGYLEAQGGMKVKYKSLIKNLEGLSEELNFSSTGQPIDAKHEYKSVQNSMNEYSIEIFFKRQGQIFIHLDKFKIIDNNDSFIIEYTRKSKYIMTFLTKIIPEKVSSKWRFNYSEDPDKVFKDLLRNINTMFRKYKYIDECFEYIYKYDNEPL